MSTCSLQLDLNSDLQQFGVAGKAPIKDTMRESAKKKMKEMFKKNDLNLMKEQ